jgi:glycosyltransferase involved in cell wall biosynthesis
MATRDRAATLGRAIDSVLAQDYPAQELVVVDDGSSDETPEVLGRYAGEQRLAALRNPRSLGLPASLNRGIAASSGGFIARVDDDDYWSDPAKLGRQVAFLQRDPRCGLLGTAYVDEWGRTIANPLDDGAIRKQMLFRCPFCHPSVLMRRAAFDEAGGYDETLSYAEDWDLWLRIGRRWRLANLADVTLVKERGAGTLSERHFLPQLAIAGELCRRYAAAYPRAWRARAYHGFSRAFFALFPPGGRVHGFMAEVFQRAFGLQRGAGG